MTRLQQVFSGRRPYVLTALLFAASLCFQDTEILRSAGGCGGGGGGGRSSQVGGVQINASGAIQRLEVDQLKQLSQQWAAALGKADSDMQKSAPLRKVSLRKLEAAVADKLNSGTPIPDDLKLLAGLQRIQYVFVYPDEHDLVLAGPAEGWKMDQQGNVVGLASGRPVMLLDDLLVALRYADEAARGGITCSIDPTTAGQQRLEQQAPALAKMSDPVAAGRIIQQAMGPQMITIGGIPSTTHFAHVLVAADYRMKRIGMNLDPSPVPGLTSYLQIMPIGGPGMSAIPPRWWLEPDYQPVRVDPQGLAFELRGAAVKCLTEDEYLAANGQRVGAGQASPAAQRWADMMTTKYEALSKKEPIFAELQNVMDLAVAAALISQEKLAQRAGCSLPLLLDAKQLPTDELEAVKQTDTVIGMVNKGGSLVLSASGGVLINSRAIAGRRETDAEVAAQRPAQVADNRWWWD